MNRGRDILLITAGMALAACAAEEAQLNIRPLADPFSAAAKRDQPMLAQAQGLLALGNTGLALEAFRKVVRTRPDSADALAGIGGCYEQMGRYDLARNYYEAALAVAPKNAVVLEKLASLLDRQGKKDEAAAARAEAENVEAEDIVAALAGLATIEQNLPTPPVASPSTGASVSNPDSPVSVVQWTMKSPAPVLSNSVTVALPEATDAMRGEKAATGSPASPAARPRLERLSMGEVALVTSDGPLWKRQVAARSRQSVTVRLPPIRSASIRPNVRLLNAARHPGLAARTREVLLERGWRKIEIGDAPQIRATSIVVYAADRQLTGQRLAAQFGFRSAASAHGRGVVVLLGRDALLRARAASRG